MKLVFIAGPYRDKTAWAIQRNIHAASEAALAVWKLGAAALCPHANSANFDGELPDETWLAGDLEMLRRCDAVYAMPGWMASVGATGELKAASAAEIPIFTDLAEVGKWILGEPSRCTVPVFRRSDLVVDER